MVRNQGRVTRFVVMAVLQSARAQSLGLPYNSALSWGLNRAIFYAAAKRGFREAPSQVREGQGKPAGVPSDEKYRLGQDEAYRDTSAKELTFMIGGEAQTVDKFEKQVASRFGSRENFRAAREEAKRIVGKSDRATLESPQRFYGEVYKPLRDELSDSWTQKYSPPKAGDER